MGCQQHPFRPLALPNFSRDRRPIELPPEAAQPGRHYCRGQASQEYTYFVAVSRHNSHPRRSVGKLFWESRSGAVLAAIGSMDFFGRLIL
jgi:hypothetical protein